MALIDAVLSIDHARHEWVVDMATHRISRRPCAGCDGLRGDADPVLAAVSPGAVLPLVPSVSLPAPASAL